LTKRLYHTVGDLTFESDLLDEVIILRILIDKNLDFDGSITFDQAFTLCVIFKSLNKEKFIFLS
jgi:hypothetical protein